MAAQSREKLKADILEVLSSLSVEERKLFSEVLKIEGSNLHLTRPHVGDELIKAVKTVIK